MWYLTQWMNRTPLSRTLCNVSTFVLRLRLCGGPALVRRASGPDHPALRRPQAGHLRRVLRGHQGLQGSGRQDPGGSQQGGSGRAETPSVTSDPASLWPGSSPHLCSGGHAAADAGVRRPHVVAGEGDQHSRGGEGLPGLVLGQASAEHREQVRVVSYVLSLFVCFCLFVYPHRFWFLVSHRFIRSLQASVRGRVPGPVPGHPESPEERRSS